MRNPRPSSTVSCRAWKGSAHRFEGHLYRLESREAIQHLFRVAASLDSMVVGEPQILGQLKSAYAIAKTEGAVGRSAGTGSHPRFQRRQARAHGDRYRPDGGLGQLRGGGTGAQDLRFAEWPLGDDHRLGQDGRTRGQAPASLRRKTHLRDQPDSGTRRRNGCALPGHAPSNTRDFLRCCTRWIS